jgi:hypothetical protein
MPRLSDVSATEYDVSPRDLTGEIYDLCSLGIAALRDEKSTRFKSIVFLLREIRSRNTQVDTILFGLEREGVM